jgi:hypothetical protein
VTGGQRAKPSTAAMLRARSCSSARLYWAISSASGAGVPGRSAGGGAAAAVSLRRLSRSHTGRAAASAPRCRSAVRCDRAASHLFLQGIDPLRHLHRLWFETMRSIPTRESRSLRRICTDLFRRDGALQQQHEAQAAAAPGGGQLM